MQAGPDLLCHRVWCLEPGLGTRDRVLTRLSVRKLSPPLSPTLPFPTPYDLDQSCLLSQLIFVILSRSGISVVALILETLNKLLELGPQFSSRKMGRLGLIPCAVPKACVSGLKRHFSASESRGLGT